MGLTQGADAVVRIRRLIARACASLEPRPPVPEWAMNYAVAWRRQVAASARAAREHEREARARRPLDRLQYVRHEQQVESLNADVAEQIGQLSTLLAAGLAAAKPLDFVTLKHEPDTRPFAPGKSRVKESEPTADKYLP